MPPFGLDDEQLASTHDRLCRHPCPARNAAPSSSRAVADAIAGVEPWSRRFCIVRSPPIFKRLYLFRRPARDNPHQRRERAPGGGKRNEPTALECPFQNFLKSTESVGFQRRWPGFAEGVADVDA